MDPRLRLAGMTEGEEDGDDGRGGVGQVWCALGSDLSPSLRMTTWSCCHRREGGNIQVEDDVRNESQI